jgi:hypothetical protein
MIVRKAKWLLVRRDKETTEGKNRSGPRKSESWVWIVRRSRMDQRPLQRARHVFDIADKPFGLVSQALGLLVYALDK